MRVTPDKVLAKKVIKDLCNYYGTKIVYTDTWIGRLYEKVIQISVINRACKKANAGDPKDWLKDRIITAGPYILMNERLSQTNNARKLFSEVVLAAHENTHKEQQDEEGVLDFYVKYFREIDLRVVFELEAIRTEMYLTIWNELPIGTADYYTDKLSRIYGFDKKTLAIINQAVERMIRSYEKHGINVLKTHVGAYTATLLEKYNK